MLSFILLLAPLHLGASTPRGCWETRVEAVQGESPSARAAEGLLRIVFYNDKRAADSLRLILAHGEEFSTEVHCEKTACQLLDDGGRFEIDAAADRLALRVAGQWAAIERDKMVRLLWKERHKLQRLELKPSSTRICSQLQKEMADTLK
ncbi:MAG: hypothetical protein AB7G93_20275 [Bdellovibrionales bacterium]